MRDRTEVKDKEGTLILYRKVERDHSRGKQSICIMLTCSQHSFTECELHTMHKVNEILLSLQKIY